MKNVFLLLILFSPVISFAQAEKKFAINGELKNIKDTVHWVYLSYSKHNENKLDSAKVKNEKYFFSGSIDEPTYASLIDSRLNPRVRTNEKDIATIFIEPATINIIHTDSFSNIVVTGSVANLEYKKLSGLLKPYDDSMEVLYEKYEDARNNHDTAAESKISDEIDAVDSTETANVYPAYLQNNFQSPIALFALKQYAGYAIDANKIEPLFEKLPEPEKNSYSGKSFKSKIEIAKKTSVGNIAPDFTQNDTLNKPVKLSSFRGKYLLLDFWASWCHPCREENPNVVKAFNKYKDKNFTVLSVSLDQPDGKEKWLNAIHKDGLTWTHVSDLKFWDNAVAKQYGIQAIPQNLLIDPQGKIIAKNLRGEDLENKLHEILGE